MLATFPITDFSEVTSVHALLGIIGGISGPDCVDPDDGFAPASCWEVLHTADRDQAAFINARGLSPEGDFLVRELMERSLVVDIAHMSERGVRQVESIFRELAAPDLYPVFLSHGNPREALAAGDFKGPHMEKPSPEWILDLIAESGGIFGQRSGPDEMVDYPPSGVANNCQGSSRSFAQAVAYLVDRGVDVGFAIDMNGMIHNSAPRFVDWGARGEVRRRSERAACLGIPAEQRAQEDLVPDDPATPFAEEMPVHLAFTARDLPAAADDRRYRTAMKHYQDGRYERARDGLRAARDGGEDTAGMWFYLGVSVLRTERPVVADNEAVAALRRAVALSPQLGEYRWYLATALLLAGQTDEALGHLDRAAARTGRFRARARELAARVQALTG